MSGLNDVKNRIKSVKSIKQITKAMNLVATIKYKKARESAEHIRHFMDELKGTVENMYNFRLESVQSAYTEVREVKKTLAVIICSDMGLCGAYNASVIKTAIQGIENKEASIIAVGNKAKEFFKKHKYEVEESYENIIDAAEYHDAGIIGRKIIEMYRKHQIDEAFIYYNKFVSTIKYIPTETQLIPLTLEKLNKDSNYIYEPSPVEVFDSIAEEYIINMIYGAMLEASASMHSSRMTAMSSATDNADNMIEELSMQYNRARQAAITNEISEIVGGTEALR